MKFKISNTDLKAFVPNSRGDSDSKFLITLDNIKNVFPTLVRLRDEINNNKNKLFKIESIPKNDLEISKIHELKKLLDFYGSDKANSHNHHILYGYILKNNFEKKKILEIGLGTNNTDTLSNMGINGKPGASIRAFKDFCPNSDIYGADVDKRILFNEERISTYHVDQTDVNSLNELATKIPSDFDLIIDDGLHSINANINTLMFGLKKIKIGGWVVIEDIHFNSIDIWKIVLNLLPNKFKPYLITGAKSLIFTAKKIN
jgi:hypothetical protein